MQAKATTVKDISRRVVNILTGLDGAAALADQTAILVADDLTPSETVQLDKSKLLDVITRHGFSNSHTVILTHTMNIPALLLGGILENLTKSHDNTADSKDADRLGLDGVTF